MSRYRAIMFLVLMWLMPIGIACADSPAKEAYLADCARCHGADGKGYVAAMRAVPGFKYAISPSSRKENGGRFPRQKVYDAIEGRKRFPAHFIGTCPPGDSDIARMMRSLIRRPRCGSNAGSSARVDYILL